MRYSVSSRNARASHQVLLVVMQGSVVFGLGIVLPYSETMVNEGNQVYCPRNSRAATARNDNDAWPERAFRWSYGAWGLAA